MKLLSLFLLLTVTARLAAQTSYIIYTPSDYSLVSATVPATKPLDFGRATFLAAVQSDLAKPENYATSMTLIAPPAPKWGKVVAGAQGNFQFHDSFAGGFVVHLRLSGLTPRQTYRLCLNGNPKLEGNDRLPTPVPGLPEEKYLDFLTVTADASGRVDGTFAIALAPGPYDVRLYVKDTTDHTIFLYHDYFRFTVE